MIARDQVGALIGHSRGRPLLITNDQELPEAYPDAEMFGSLPVYALYVRHVVGLTVSNRQVRWTQPDPWSAAVVGSGVRRGERVEGLRMAGCCFCDTATAGVSERCGAHVEELMAGLS
jgi:hypothetical protein